MNGRLLVTLGLIISLGLGGWFSLRSATPKSAEIQTKVPNIQVVSPDTFKNPVINQVKGFTQFGQLPVIIDKGFQGRDNPFVPY